MSLKRSKRYKSIIHDQNETKKTIGLIRVTFKTICNQHKRSIKSSRSSQTILSRFLRQLNYNDIKILWSIIPKIMKVVFQKHLQDVQSAI